MIRSLRLPRAFAALSLMAFALGSNHCLIEASRGHSGMACLALPATPAPAGGSCCHAAAKHSDPSSQPSSDRSCCIDPAPIPTTAAFDAADVLGPVLAWIAPADFDFSPAAPAIAAEWTPFGSPPPTASPPLPPSSRAPPLA